MNALAAIRPDDWNLPLFLHVLGAMVLVGVLVLALGAIVSVWRGGSVQSLRLGFRSLLWAGVPAFLAMRVGAQWIYDEEGFSGGGDPDWIGIGFMISDIGLIMMLVAIVLAGLAVRRAGRTAAESGEAAPAVATRVAAGLVGLLIAAYVIAIWAMTTKPG